MKRTTISALLVLGSLSPLPAQDASFSLYPRRLDQTKPENWKASETAVIVCDMWDSHHSQNAAKRTGEIAPRLNDLLKDARKRGAFVIHSPSSCMDFYKDTAARKRAQAAPKAANLPAGIEKWLNWIDDKEQNAGYPIDHSDGGEDDDRAELAKWREVLKGQGRDPGAPWKRQIDSIEIDQERDAITDDGVENWSLLQQRGIKNVILAGVHTNMCVLGRPFGLRQMAKNGVNVVLVRDLTDTMYNPAMSPKVSHFRGTDLIIRHVERFVCPTISSDQVLGGKPFRFAGDARPHMAVLLAEDEYETWNTVPAFMDELLSNDFRWTIIREAKDSPHSLEGLERISDADLLFVSVRRRAPTEAQMKWLHEYVAAGRPVVGIRTASHAFALRDKSPEPGHVTWDKFDPEVFGGHYRNHTGNEEATFAWVADEARSHPIVHGLPSGEFPTGGSLYQVDPLESGTRVLLQGRAKQEKQPVAWIRESKGGRVFYTSLGHPKDFASPAFRQLLRNGIYWAAGKDVPMTNLSSSASN